MTNPDTPTPVPAPPAPAPGVVASNSSPTPSPKPGQPESSKPAEGATPQPAGELSAPSAELPHSYDGQTCEICDDPDLKHGFDGKAVPADEVLDADEAQGLRQSDEQDK